MKSPVYNVQAIPVEKIQANTYNPNHVAPPEMKLLYDSIKEDGYTMPIVCYYLPDVDKYEIVDGFHRYTVMLTHKDIYEREGGKLPVVVIEKDISNRMASTVRHNRARGTHDVDLMANIVKELREAGMKDAWIMKLLHHEGDEGKARRGLGEIQELVMKSPVYNVQAIPVEKIQANTYNPNHVAPPEMKLLYDSIKEDGYTMPIVCYYLPDVDKYEIVDGFHRYTVMLTHKDIYEREGGKLPVVVIEKDISNRMASTVRHNRARGTHDVDLMANIVKELREAGMKDAWIMKHLGMDADELLRLKQITGLAALFKDREFSASWDI